MKAYRYGRGAWSAARRRADAASTETGDLRWDGLYRLGAAAALFGVLLLPVQVILFALWPPPETVAAWFALFQSSWLLGLLSLDLLYLLQNTLLILVYLALYAALRQSGEPAMQVALGFGLVGIAAYFASNTAFEMLALSDQYAAAATAAQRAGLLAAGQLLLALYKGTAFNVYYVLNAAALLIIATVMWRGRVFSRGAAYAGLAAGVLMLVPSTAGTLGLVFAFASLAPWALFSVLVARDLFGLARRSHG